ncbi:MAG: HU family DNA-binding protein [Clostridia bacterium]|nr:HU family DNA-binding protein [Clostridia bacterium]
MNKTQLVDVVAKATELKKKDAEVAVAAVLDAVANALADGDKVQLIGFGSFEVKTRAARKGHNPQNPGQIIDIPASKNVAFSASKTLKERLG